MHVIVMLCMCHHVFSEIRTSLNGIMGMVACVLNSQVLQLPDTPTSSSISPDSTSLIPSVVSTEQAQLREYLLIASSSAETLLRLFNDWSDLSELCNEKHNA